jgi:hypothetical protein
MTFIPIHHQFSLFEYNAMRKTRIPMKRISRERMEQAMIELRSNPRPMLEVLRSINDDLENYEKRLTNRI